LSTRKDRDAQARWCSEHKVLRITNEAHVALLRYAGKLQMERGEDMTTSKAIEELVKQVLKD